MSDTFDLRPRRQQEVFNKDEDNDDRDEENYPEMGYQETLMYGRYYESLRHWAKQEAKRQKALEEIRKIEKEKRLQELQDLDKKKFCYHPVARVITCIWKHTFVKIGEDWVFLAVLGIIMALISYALDFGIESCNHCRLWLYHHLGNHMALQYFAWISLPVFLVLFSAGFVHIVSPNAIGSGIPEMKTILRGVVLKEYLSGRTLIAKTIGLIATLGSGMPLGKEGPFVHIASIVANLLSKLVTSFQGIYANESRNSEMLAAACAVGAACCFGSPIGGVLFSIEVTSVYFAVRNYWRGFFSAVCGAVTFRVLAIWFHNEETIVTVFKTGFDMKFPYDAKELLVFAMIGVSCGLGGALYVYIHRRYVLWMRANKKLNKFLQKNRFIYPLFISLLVSTLSFPPFIGQFQASDISTHDQIHVLFANYTWSQHPLSMSVEEWAHVKHWITPWTGIFVNLTIYILMTFFLSILASTLPVPSGVVIPSFMIGAAFGRLVGEAMHVCFPEGIRHGDIISYIAPGGYATVGAAAFSGAVTHKISISVIVFEMTGQITHCIPVLIGVLIANAVSSLLQHSYYDTIIMIKQLPYLPDILPASSSAYNLFVEDFMVKDVQYICYGMTFKELKDLLKESTRIKSFPLVDNPSHMILLGSIQRTELVAAIERQIGKDRRLKVAKQRYEEEQMRLKERREEEKKRILMEKLNVEAKKRKMEEENDEEDNQIGEPTKISNDKMPSRFHITKESGGGFSPVAKSVEIPHTIHEHAEEDSPDDIEPVYESPSGTPRSQPESRPTRSILKRNRAYSIDGYDAARRRHSLGTIPKSDTMQIPKRKRSRSFSSPSKRLGSEKDSSVQQETPTGSEGGIKTTMGNLFKRTLSLASKSLESPRTPYNDMYKKSALKVDMTVAEQYAWEKEQMLKMVDFDMLHIDPAPFQLVEKTSLLKVHSLFSMLGINHAYVTAIGRLIGVVGLKELRNAIEDINSGHGLASVASARSDEDLAKAKMKIEIERQRSNGSHRMGQFTLNSTNSAFPNGAKAIEDEDEDEEEALLETRGADKVINRV